MVLRLFLILSFVLTAVPSRAGTPMSSSTFESLSADKKAKIYSVIKTEIRHDIEVHLKTILKNISKSLKGEPMSPESQAVIIKGMYGSIQAQLALYGVSVDEALFKAKMVKILSWSSQYGLFPQALTIGGMAHAQAGLGAAVGMEFNYYFDQGDLKVTTYNLFGVEAGFAEQLKINFYAALCFGSCTGGSGQGLFVGLDAMATAGVGLDFYIEAGVDVTDLISASFTGEKYRIKDLYDSRAIYVGFGFDIGEGFGLSGNVFYYKQTDDVVLVPRGQMINPTDIASMKLF